MKTRYQTKRRQVILTQTLKVLVGVCPSSIVLMLCAGFIPLKIPTATSLKITGQMTFLLLGLGVPNLQLDISEVNMLYISQKCTQEFDLAFCLAWIITEILKWKYV